MGLFVLESDTVTMLSCGHAEVTRNVLLHDPNELAVAIITVEEVLTGWYSQVRKARKDDQLLRAYAALQQAVELFGTVRVLPFNSAALDDFKTLRRANRRGGTNDLRIAAIVRSNSAVLITRNAQDFKDIQGLSVEDWTQTSQ
jgi:tRNA(fMet)-specific endonuclease VapC